MADSFLPLRGGRGAFSIAPSGSATGSTGNLDASCPQVRLLWVPTTPGDRCQVRWGVGTQTAVTTDMQLTDDGPEAFTKGDADTLSVIGTGTLYVICGHGD
jgi:hypothetical protein